MLQFLQDTVATYLLYHQSLGSMWAMTDVVSEFSDPAGAFSGFNPILIAFVAKWGEAPVQPEVNQTVSPDIVCRFIPVSEIYRNVGRGTKERAHDAWAAAASPSNDVTVIALSFLKFFTFF